MMRLFNIFIILFITLISSSSVSSTKVESCDDSTTCQTTNANSGNTQYKLTNLCIGYSKFTD